MSRPSWWSRNSASVKFGLMLATIFAIVYVSSAYRIRKSDECAEAGGILVKDAADRLVCMQPALRAP